MLYSCKYQGNVIDNMLSVSFFLNVLWLPIYKQIHRLIAYIIYSCNIMTPHWYVLLMRSFEIKIIISCFISV